jgi:bloom syndrome protein
VRRPRLNACLQSRQLLTKRLKELKAALAARAALGAVARQSPTPAMSSSSTVASDPPRPTDYFPPSAEAGPSRLPSFPQSTHLGMHPQFSGDVSGNASPLAGYRALSFSVGENSAPAPPPRVQNIPSIRRPRQAQTPPPDIDELDLAMAEQIDDPPQQLIPPSSSPSPPPIATPSRTSRDNALARRAALAELENIPPNKLFSSPPAPTPAKEPRSPSTATRPIRTNAEAGPSTLPPTVQAPREIRIEVRHPWSKEVEDKMKTYFKIPKFRFHQKEAIDETMAGKDGKSKPYPRLQSLINQCSS